MFWNLRASTDDGQLLATDVGCAQVPEHKKSTPVQFNEAGVALVSGFSGQLLKLFMSKPGDMEPGR